MVPLGDPAGRIGQRSREARSGPGRDHRSALDGWPSLLLTLPMLGVPHPSRAYRVGWVADRSHDGMVSPPSRRAYSDEHVSSFSP